MAGNDSYTLLLTNCDGTNGSTTLTDSSVSGTTNTVTAFGNAQVSTTNPKFGTGAATFDGSGDYLGTDLELNFGTDDYTVDVWFNTDVVNQDKQIVNAQSNAATTSVFILRVSDTGKLEFLQRDTGGTLDTVTGTTSLSTGTWYHATVCRNSTATYLFLDGSLEASTTNVRNLTPSVTTYFDIGGYVDQGIQYFDGLIDEIRISSNSRIDDINDPLYISSGVPGDGFTPPTAAYSEITYTGFDNTNVILKGEEATGFDNTNIILAGQVPTGFDNTNIILKGELLKTGFDNTDIVLKGELATGFDNTEAILRGPGQNSYFFDLRDSTGAQVATATGAPPTTVFTDVFTGLADGTYTVHAQSVTKFKNLSNTLNETFVTFDIVAGVPVLPAPNEISSLQYQLRAGASVYLEWVYSDVNQGIAPDDFVVYVNTIFNQRVTYTGPGRYNLLLTGLSEVSTDFNVSVAAGAQETNGLTVTATPDGTAPDSVPFTFEVI